METKPLVSLAEVKALLGIRENITTLDARLTLFIGTATGQIEKATGRSFTRQEHIEFFTSRKNTRLDYNFLPDIGFSGIDTSRTMEVTAQSLHLKGCNIDPEAAFDVWYDPTYLGSSDPYGETTKLTIGKDYVIDFDTDKVILQVPTRYCPRAIKVRYTAGYSENEQGNLTDDIPDDLKTACMVQVQFLNVKLRNDNVGMGFERTVGAKDKVTSTPFLTNVGLTPEVAGMLTHLKRIKTGAR